MTIFFFFVVGFGFIVGLLTDDSNSITLFGGKWTNDLCPHFVANPLQVAELAQMNSRFVILVILAIVVIAVDDRHFDFFLIFGIGFGTGDLNPSSSFLFSVRGLC